MPRSLLDLPDETLTEILRHIPDTSPYRNVMPARLTCALLWELGKAAAFSSLQFVADPGERPLQRRLDFFEGKEREARFVREFYVIGRTTEFIVDVASCLVLNAVDVAQIYGVFPLLRSLGVERGLWRPGPRGESINPFNNITTLLLHGSSILEDETFPTSIVQFCPAIKRLSFSFSPAALIEREVIERLRTAVLPVDEIAFPSSLPFQGSFVNASVFASRDTATDVDIEIPSVVFPAFFTQLPEAIDLSVLKKLRHAKITLPVDNFPDPLAAECTWAYTDDVLNSIDINTPKISIKFACGDVEWSDPYSCLEEFPVAMLIGFVDDLSPELRVNIILQAPAGSEMPRWESAMDLKEEWRDLAERPKVRMVEVIDTKEYSPFAIAYPQEDDMYGLFLWWDDE